MQIVAVSMRSCSLLQEDSKIWHGHRIIVRINVCFTGFRLCQRTYNVDDTENDTSGGPHGQEGALVVVTNVVLDGRTHEILPNLRAFGM